MYKYIQQQKLSSQSNFSFQEAGGFTNQPFDPPMGIKSIFPALKYK